VIDETQDLLLAQIHADKDYFCQEGLFSFSLQNEAVDYRKRDYLFSGGDWRGIEFPAIKKNQTLGSVLVIGHSDKETTVRDVVKIRALTSYRRIYSSNFSGFGRIPFGLEGRLLPLGLSNPTAESQLHIVYGDASILSAAFHSRSRPLVMANLEYIYANFSVSTAKAHRQTLHNSLRKIPHIHHGTIDPSIAGRLKYLSEIRETGLVVCPRGNGLDTHRLYETLYMGAIPILLRKSYQFRICRTFGFPVVGLEDWGQLAEFDLVKQLASQECFSGNGLAALRLSSWTGDEGPLSLVRKD